MFLLLAILVLAVGSDTICPSDYEAQLGECLGLLSTIHAQTNATIACRFTMDLVDCVVPVIGQCCEQEKAQLLLHNLPLSNMTEYCSERDYIVPCS